MNILKAIVFVACYLFLLVANEAQAFDEKKWSKIFLKKSDDYLVDDDSFYLSQGRDLRGEVKVLSQKLLETPEGNFNNHVACRFPARSHWLRKSQGKLEVGVPKFCKDYWSYRKSFNVDQLTLVFPTEYFGNPASMFGHTFLKLSNSQQEAMLGYSIAYGADISDKPGLVYAFKGVFGYYPGYLSVNPYYTSTNLYNDMEDRDIWELAIKTTPEKIDLLLKHLWELKDKKITYYFFSVNCSSLLLDILQNVDENISPKESERAFFFPMDMVISLRDAGMIEKQLYRPSMSSRLSRLSSNLSGATRKNEPQIREDFHKDGNLKSELYDLDLLLHYWSEKLRYDFKNGDIDRDTYSQKYLAVLGRLSKIPKPRKQTYTPSYSILNSRSPRLIGVGMQRIGGRSVQPVIRFRPANHGQDDPPYGFPIGSILNIFDSRVSFVSGKPILDTFTLLHLASWQQSTSLLRSFSWEVESSYERDNAGWLIGGALGKSKIISNKVQLSLLLGMAGSDVQDDRDRSLNIQLISRLRLRSGGFFSNSMLRLLQSKDNQKHVLQMQGGYMLDEESALLLSLKSFSEGKQQLSAAVNRYF